MNNTDILKLFHSDGAIAAVIAEGNCMLPEIHAGDILLINTACGASYGNTVIFRYNGKQYCKRFYPQQDGTVIMQPADLRHYKSMKLKQSEITIIGTVISAVHEVPSYMIPVAEPGEALRTCSGNNGNAVLLWQKGQVTT